MFSKRRSFCRRSLTEMPAGSRRAHDGPHRVRGMGAQGDRSCVGTEASLLEVVLVRSALKARTRWSAGEGGRLDDSFKAPLSVLTSRVARLSCSTRLPSSRTSKLSSKRSRSSWTTASLIIALPCGGVFCACCPPRTACRCQRTRTDNVFPQTLAANLAVCHHSDCPQVCLLPR